MHCIMSTAGRIIASLGLASTAASKATDWSSLPVSMLCLALVEVALSLGLMMAGSCRTAARATMMLMVALMAVALRDWAVDERQACHCLFSLISHPHERLCLAGLIGLGAWLADHFSTSARTDPGVRAAARP